MKSCVFDNFHTFSFIGSKSCNYSGYRQENHYCSPQLSAEAERNEQADCRIQRRCNEAQDFHRLHRRDLVGVHQELRPVRFDRQETHLQEVIWGHQELLPRKSWKCNGSIGYWEHTQP